MATQDFEFIDDMVIDVAKGDFSIIESDQQHIEHIITANKGHFYEFPTIGAGKDDLLNSSESRARINQVISENLEQDDYKNAEIRITKEEDLTTIEVAAKRRKQR